MTPARPWFAVLLLAGCSVVFDPARHDEPEGIAEHPRLNQACDRDDDCGPNLFCTPGGEPRVCQGCWGGGGQVAREPISGEVTSLSIGVQQLEAPVAGVVGRLFIAWTADLGEGAVVRLRMYPIHGDGFVGDMDREVDTSASSSVVAVPVGVALVSGSSEPPVIGVAGRRADGISAVWIGTVDATVEPGRLVADGLLPPDGIELPPDEQIVDSFVLQTPVQPWDAPTPEPLASDAAVAVYRVARGMDVALGRSDLRGPHWLGVPDGVSLRPSRGALGVTGHLVVAADDEEHAVLGSLIGERLEAIPVPTPGRTAAPALGTLGAFWSGGIQDRIFDVRVLAWPSADGQLHLEAYDCVEHCRSDALPERAIAWIGDGVGVRTVAMASSRAGPAVGTIEVWPEEDRIAVRVLDDLLWPAALPGNGRRVRLDASRAGVRYLPPLAMHRVVWDGFDHAFVAAVEEDAGEGPHLALWAPYSCGGAGGL